MKLIRKSTEDEMILEFLKGELSSDRFNNKLISVLDDLDISKDIILNGKFTLEENNIRKRIMNVYRGYPDKELFNNFPKNISWEYVMFDENDLNNIYYIDYDYWNLLSRGTSKSIGASITIKEGTEIFDVSNKPFIDGVEYLKNNTFPPIILITCNDKKYLIIEGHSRVTVYGMIPEKFNGTYGFIGHCSEEEMSKYDKRMSDLDYFDRVERYSKVSNPEELMEFMDNNISYGIYGIDGVVYDDWNNSIDSSFQVACQTKYALCDSHRLIKYKYGNCFDQVELERDWFKRNNYEFKTFYIWFLFEEDNNYMTHSYLVYKDKTSDDYCYFEHADYNNKGIKKFKSYKDAVLYQMNKHIESNRKYNIINDDVLNRLIVYEFDISKYECLMDEYISNILDSKVIYKNGEFCE